ncbi:Conserved_hypothetical protein [Hexamita inflata]|uniref:Glycoside hydrolase family 5 domain-containing protein n=1 Tax=Hexamita inflata TaxID=28002 RepID=A0AA86R5N5_9EUKA|nr:Conserved hypothetical protein [Hexamita inflata]
MLLLIVSQLNDQVKNFELFSRNSQIEDQDGNKVSIKGYNYFGFNTQSAVVHGLWDINLESILDWTKTQGFNAIRVPFTADLALNLETTKLGYIDYDLNPNLKGLTPGQILDYFINQAAARGLVILLDMHDLYMAGDIDPLWYDSNLTESKVLQAWSIMIKRYNQWNVIGVDIKNEPHDEITWGTGNISSDFDLYCQRAGDMIHSINPKLLVFVEGIHKWINWDYSNWGESLQGVLNNPVTLKVPNKVVYSPHIYGKNDTIANQSVHWDQRFGYIVKQKLGPAVVIGEWGGDVYEKTIDYPFLVGFSQWMVSNNITDNFHWCLNPNSVNTKGLVADDWITPVQPKMDIINQIIKTPYKFPLAPACASATPYMNGSMCQESCATGYYSIIQGVFTCQTACSLYYINTTNGNMKQCVSTCPTSSLFRDGQQCVSQCVSGQYQNVSGIFTCQPCSLYFINTTNNVTKCVTSCPSSAPYKNDSMCQQSCQTGFYSIVAGILICQPSCQLYYLNSTNGNAKQCVNSCPSIAQFKNGSICQSSCPSGYYSILQNILTCQAACSLYYINSTNGNTKQCVYSCPSVAPVKSGKQCIKSANKNSDIGTICGVVIAAVILMIIIVLLATYQVNKNKKLKKQTIKLSSKYNQYV